LAYEVMKTSIKIKYVISKTKIVISL